MRDEATKGAERESVLTKIEDAMDYIEPFLDKFPRPEKGYAGLATRIRQTLCTMAERAMDTQKCFYAKSTLKELTELFRMKSAVKRYNKQLGK